MIERLQTRDVFPTWLDSAHTAIKFLRITGSGKAYLSLADERETLYVFTGDWLPNTIAEAIDMIDEMP